MFKDLNKSFAKSLRGRWITSPYEWSKDSENRVRAAGWVFNTGNYGEVISSQYKNIEALYSHGIGAVHLNQSDVGQIIGSALFITVGHILSGVGSREDKWFRRGSYMAIAAVAATEASTISQLPATGWFALAGTALFTVSYAIGAKGQDLYRAFKDSASAFKRNVLGRPRLTMGIGAATSMMFMLPDSINPITAGILICWAAGELLLASTKPDRSIEVKPQRSQQIRLNT